MAVQASELAWLDERETVTVGELCRACAFSATEIHELVEYGALVPLREGAPAAVFSAEWVMPLRTAGRLRRDFDLDVFSISLLLDYLHRIAGLERRVRSLEALLPADSRREP